MVTKYLKRHLDTSYERVAGIYEVFDSFNYGISSKSRDFFLGKLPIRPQNPLIVGCGPGCFAQSFAIKEAPLKITINDVSSAMIEKTVTRFKTSGWSGELIKKQGDIMCIDVPEKFDFISMHYTLNLFEPYQRVEMIRRLCDISTDDCVFLVADFAKPSNNLLLPLAYMNWWLGNLVFYLLANNKPNSLGDIERELQAAGLRLVGKKCFMFGIYGSFMLAKNVNKTSLGLQG